MTIAVTGATGHLGRLIVTDLIDHGVDPGQIIAGGRDVGRLADLAARGVRPARLDYADPASMRAAFTGADTLMLVSGSEIGQRVAQHRAAIEAAASVGVRRVVYTSAPGADQSPLLVAPEHKATEEILQASGLAVTILRNNWYTENYVPAVEQARATGVVLTSAGDGRVASAPRADFAAAASAVLRGDGHDGAVYELGGDEPWTFDELAAAIGAVVGRDVVARQVSPDEHLAILRSAGLDDATAGWLVAMDGDIRAGLLAGGGHDLSSLTGRATTPLVEGLRAATASR